MMVTLLGCSAHSSVNIDCSFLYRCINYWLIILVSTDCQFT